MAADFARADGGIAYEGLSRATRNNTWQRAWDVVRRANRPNVGLVIDSFHIIVHEFPSSLNPVCSSSLPSAEAVAGLRTSMSALSATVPGSKLYFVQLADAAAIEPAEFWALGSTHVERLRMYARMRRIYPGGKGGWMPTEIVEEVQREPWSFEVFHSRLEDLGKELPGREAERGQKALRWLEAGFYRWYTCQVASSKRGVGKAFLWRRGRGQGRVGRRLLG
jgi:hypothetical protein